ncbi:hypothetical protein Sste5346_005205 [Sporothrix stenoceras]|uniref:DUF6546 domain-containing protein n=1 Tax=Sporothrix stenoceras TaxID=5173 RepID=A0ABR3Z789_9PEZI
MPWSSLPTELRLVVFDRLARITEADRRALKLQLDTTTKPPSMATYTAVCREWHWFFEPYNFRRLVIDDSEVGQFAELVKGPTKRHRLAFIRHLHFHGRLDDYDCSQCTEKSDEDASVREDGRIMLALSTLIAVLSTRNKLEGEEYTCHPDWDEFAKDTEDRSSDPKGSGLTLELSTSSWSDPHHSVRNFRQCRDYPYELPEDIEDRYDAYKAYRERERTHPNNTHGWEGGLWRRHVPDIASATKRVLGAMPMGSVKRLIQPHHMGYISRGEAIPGLMKPNITCRASIIRAIVVRRRFYRNVDHRLLHSLMGLSSESLNDVRLELWEPEYVMCFHRYYWDKKLQNLSIFVDVTIASQYLDFGLTPDMRGQGIAYWTHPHENIALTHLMDATDIFEGAQQELKSHSMNPDWPEAPRITAPFWPNLVNLALTDMNLMHVMIEEREGSEEDEGETPGQYAISLTADMLVHMPKLETLELWCGDKDLGCFFRFETFQGSSTTPPTVTIGSTWDLKGDRIGWWTPKLQSVWTKKAKQYSQLPLSVRNIALPEIRSPSGLYLWAYMEVIDKLALRDLVIDPVSYYDMTQDATHGTDEAN